MSEWSTSPACVECLWPSICDKDGLCWERVRVDEEDARQAKAARRRAQLRADAGLPAEQPAVAS